MAHSSNYERVAQDDDAISLHPVTQDYNYNTGVPTSPPPSFRSTAHSTTSSTSTLRGIGGGSSSDISGLCTPPTTHPSDPTPPYASSLPPDLLALPPPTPATSATIHALHTRIAHLEDALGRLLLAHDDAAAATPDPSVRGTNCCVSLPAGDAALRRRGDNCCVWTTTAASAEGASRRSRREMALVACVCVVLLFTMGYGIGTWSARGHAGTT